MLVHQLAALRPSAMEQQNEGTTKNECSLCARHLRTHIGAAAAARCQQRTPGFRSTRGQSRSSSLGDCGSRCSQAGDARGRITKHRRIASGKRDGRKITKRPTYAGALTFRFCFFFLYRAYKASHASMLRNSERVFTDDHVSPSGRPHGAPPTTMVWDKRRGIGSPRVATVDRRINLPKPQYATERASKPRRLRYTLVRRRVCAQRGKFIRGAYTAHS